MTPTVEPQEPDESEEPHSNVRALAEWGCCLTEGCSGCVSWLSVLALVAWWRRRRR